MRIIISHIKLLSVFVIFLISININGQTKSLSSYNSTKLLLEEKETELDSLNLLLQQKVNLITIEKEKQNESKLVDLLAGTSNLTNKIEQLEIYIDLINRDLNLIKKELFTYYSKQIDSLKKINGTNTTPKIIELTEKKLAVSNKIDLLSFEPTRVLGLSQTSDPIKQKTYYEYLSSANLEVEDKISDIRELKSEINNIISLNEEKESFLEELDFDNNISGYKSINQTNALSEADYFNESDSKTNSLRGQAFLFNSLLGQLKVNKRTNQSFSIRSLKDGYYTKNNLKDFYELISQVEKQLIEYQFVIKNKLEIK